MLTEPLSDEERLEALRVSGLLKKPTDARLDHICFTAQSLLQADASQLNAITADEQVYVAEWPQHTREPSPLKDSGCREVILCGHTMAVDDTREHPVMCLMDWSHEWRSYLGAPVLFGGQVVGTICVLVREPRVWSWREKAIIESLSYLVSAALA